MFMFGLDHFFLCVKDFNCTTVFSREQPYLGVGNPVRVGILDDRLIPLPFLQFKLVVICEFDEVMVFRMWKN